jgi:hypothetical protein
LKLRRNPSDEKRLFQLAIHVCATAEQKIARDSSLVVRTHAHTHLYTHTRIWTRTHAFFFWTTKHKCPSHRNWEMSPIRFVPRLRNNHLTFKFIQKIIFFKNQFEKSTSMQIFVKCQMSYSLKKIQCQKKKRSIEKVSLKIVMFMLSDS